MIQITDKSTIKAYYFPKSGSEMVSTLNLYSELTHAEYDFDVEESGSSSMYYTLVLDFSDVADGEYAYTLSNADGRVVESGELRVGTIGEGHVVYEYYESFTTYNPETGSEEHVPYYGDCAEAIQIAHEQGYEEGHEDGFAEGEETQKGKLGTKNIFINGTYTREDGWNQVNVAVPQPLLQDEKNVTLESPTAEIRPDNMAVAMKKVTVDATNLIDEAYAEGEANQKAKLTDKFITQNGTYEREDGWNKVTVAMPQPLIQDEKSVTLESPTAEIRPDGGAVAVRKVLVDATDLIDETFEDGKEAQKELMETLEIETVEGIYENEEGWNKVVVTRPESTLVAVQSVYTYFDLGFIPQANDRIVARFSVDGKNPSMSGSDASIWGYYNGWMDNRAYMLCFSGTKIQSYCGRAYNQNITTITLGTPINVTYTPTLVTVDGTEGSLSANYVPQTTYNFWLGAASSENGSFRTPNAFTWYSFKVYRDDTLILDLVPAVNSDGYGCFKDTLTGTEYNATNPSACTPIYDQNDYDRGYDDGKEAQKALMTSLNVTSNGSYEREDGYNSITVNVQGASIVEMTQAQYDALTEYDDNIIYAIIG